MCVVLTDYVRTGSAERRAEGILGDLIRLKHHDYKVRYVEKFLSLFKEWQALQTKSDKSAGVENVGPLLTKQTAQQIALTK